MTDRDPELEKLLSVFRKNAPTPTQQASWQQAALAEARRGADRPRFQFWIQLTAAASIGFVAGVLAMSLRHPAPEEVAVSATIEHVFAKAD